MKHTLIFILLIPSLTFGQDFLLEFDRYNPIYNFEWSGFEVPNDYEIKIKFIEFVEKNDILKSERNGLDVMDEKLRFHLRSVDLNNDQLADIIYQGPHMGEGSVFRIFIQTKTAKIAVETMTTYLNQDMRQQ
jgi:hypothetical protein